MPRMCLWKLANLDRRRRDLIYVPHYRKDVSEITKKNMDSRNINPSSTPIRQAKPKGLRLKVPPPPPKTTAWRFPSGSPSSHQPRAPPPPTPVASTMERHRRLSDPGASWAKINWRGCLWRIRTFPSILPNDKSTLYYQYNRMSILISLANIATNWHLKDIKILRDILFID